MPEPHTHADLAFAQAIIASCDDAIIGKSLDGTVISWNAAAERLFGYTAKEMLGTSILRLFPPDRVNEECALITQVTQGRQISHFQTQRVGKDGSRIDISVTLSPVRNADGNVIGVSKIARAIPMFVRAQQEAELCHAVFEHSTDALIVTTLEGTVIQWNDAATTLFGFSVADMIGSSIGAIVPPDRWGEETALIGRLLQGKKVSHFETQRISQSGAPLIVSVSLSPVRSPTGQIVAIAKLIRDIGESHTLRANARQMTAIIDYSDDAVISKSLDGTVITWNASAERIFGFSAADMIGQPITRLFPRDRLNEEADLIGKIVNGKAVSHFETQRVRKDGTVVDISATLSPIRDEQGRIVAVSKIARDISRWRRLRDEFDQVSSDLKTIVEHSPGLISYWNADYTNRFANKAYAATFGLNEQEIRGRHVRDVLGAAMYAASSPWIEAARAGERQSYERLTRLPNGEVRYDQLDYVPDDASEGARGLFVFVNDITARKVAEEAVAASAARFKRLYDDTPAMMHAIDACGRLQSVSGHWLLKLGYSREEVLGRPLADFLTPASRDRLYSDHLGAFQAGHNSVDVEYQMTCKDGRIIDVALSAIAERDSRGQFAKGMAVIEDVTARKAAEAALRSANERLEMATDAARIGIWEFDVPGYSVRCDLAMGRIYGLPAESLDTIERWALTLHPEDREATQNAVADALDGKCEYDTEFRVVRPDGEIRYVKGAGRVQRDATDAPLRMVGINIDVTERKRAEAAVVEASSHAHALYTVTSAIIEQHHLDALLRAVVDTVAEALPADRVTLITFDLDQHIVTQFVTGGPGSEFVVQVPFDELLQGLSGWVLRTGQPALSSKRVPDPREEFDVQRRRAETHCGDILVVPIGYRGRVLGTLTAINSPTGADFADKHVALMTAMAGHVAVAIAHIGLFQELADSASQLRSTSERLTLATDAAGMGVWEWDPVSNTFRWDDQMYRLYARARLGDLQPYALWSQALHTEDRQRAAQELQTALDSELDLDTEYRIIRPDGAVRHLKTAARVQRDVAGAPLRLVGITLDITERNEAVAHARAANLAKSQFLANMSHEIRTPLNAVIGLGYLLEQTHLSEEQRSFVSKIEFAGRSLLSVVNNVLDLSKIEAGEMVLEDVGFDVISLAQHVAQMLMPQAQAKGIDLIVRPAQEVPRLLGGDATRLRQILTNLLNNAIKFTAQGHVALEMKCGARTADGIRLHCIVSDTGIGIAPQAIERLFTPFTQADASTTRRFGGTGLGLSISHRLIEFMGGEIGVTSDLGVGSRFWIEIPLRIASESDVDMPASGTRPLQILIMENLDAQRPLHLVIHQLGWLTHTADNIDEAVRRLRSDQAGVRPDVVIIDGALKNLNPLQCISRLRSECWQLELPPIIVLDNELQSYRQSEPLQVLASGVLARPVGSSSLFNAVNSALAMRDGDRNIALQATNFDQMSAQWLAGACILVVDDSEVNRIVAQHILVKQGATVALAGNGSEAVARLRESPDAFDVVLMDVQMPELDGYAATRQIRIDLKLKKLPVIALTAGALVSEREQAFAAGMNDFLSKPLEPTTLIRVVRRFVELKRGAPLPVAIVDRNKHDSNVATGLSSIDAKAVQQLFGNDVQLFTDLVGRVLREFGEFALPRILDLPEEPARKQLAATLHKLRGSAGTICAKSVQRLAGAAERALEEGQPPDFVEAILRQLAVEFTALSEEVQPLLASAADKAIVPAEANDVPPATDAIIDQLLDLLDNQNLDAIDLFAGIASSLRATLGDRCFAALKDAVEDLDFRLAATMLRTTGKSGGSTSASTSLAG